MKSTVAERYVLEILLGLTIEMQREHPNLQIVISNYKNLSNKLGLSSEQVLARLNKIAEPFGIKLGLG